MLASKHLIIEAEGQQFRVKPKTWLLGLMWRYTMNRVLKHHRRTGDTFSLVCPFCHKLAEFVEVPTASGKLVARRVSCQTCAMRRAWGRDPEPPNAA